MAIQNKRITLVCVGLAVCSALVAMAAQAQGVSFKTARNLPVGTNPYSVAVGDFNLDGRPDLAVANQDSNNVSVLINSTDL